MTNKEETAKEILEKIAKRLPRGEDFEAELNELFNLFGVEVEEYIAR